MIDSAHDASPLHQAHIGLAVAHCSESARQSDPSVRPSRRCAPCVVPRVGYHTNSVSTASRRGEGSRGAWTLTTLRTSAGLVRCFCLHRGGRLGAFSGLLSSATAGHPPRRGHGMPSMVVPCCSLPLTITPFNGPFQPILCVYFVFAANWRANEFSFVRSQTSMKRHKEEEEDDALSREKARGFKRASAQKRVEKPLVPADASVGVVVLSDPALLRHVTSFVEGIPHRLLDLEANNGVSMDAKRKANKAIRELYALDMYLDRETPQVKSLIENQRLAYRSLTDLAIETDDIRSLEMVYELRKEGERRKHPRFRFYHAMPAAARYGRLQMLKWLSRLDEAAKWLEDSWLLDAAIQSGSLETVQWVMSHYRGDEEHAILTKTLDQIAKNGALDVLKLILTSFPSAQLTTKAMDGAAEGNHFDVVLYLHETRNEGCTTHALDNAAGNGHLDMVKWLHENRSEGCTLAAIDNAATNGHLHVIKYLHEHRTEGCSSRAMEGSAENGYLEVVRYLHEKCGRYFTVDMLLKGMKNLEIVRYVLDNGGPDGWYRRVADQACGVSLEHAQLFHHGGAYGFTIYSMDEAAAAGHLETVRFLHEHRTEGCTTAAMDRAARGGYLDVVRFLHAHRSEGCTSAAMDNAAAGGHFDIVLFLHENRDEGCSVNAIDEASTNGHLEIVKFLHDNYAEGCTEKALEGAAASGHLGIVRFLIESVLPSESSSGAWKGLGSAAENGHLPIVHYLIETTSVSTSWAIKQAAREGYSHVLDCFLPTSDYDCLGAVESAAITGHYDVVELLLKSMRMRSPSHTMAVADAADMGYFEIIELLISKSRDFFISDAITNAAGGGHLEVLKLALKCHKVRALERMDQGITDFYEDETDEEGEEEAFGQAIMYAATNGHLRCLQLLYNHRPTSFTSDIMVNAARGGYIDIVRFLHEKTSVQASAEAFEAAVEHGHLPIVQFFVNLVDLNLVCSTSVIDSVACKGDLDMLKYCTAHRCEQFSIAAMNGAAKNGHLNVVRYLHELGTTRCTTEAMDNAACKGHLDVVRFLQENRLEGCTQRAMNIAASCGYTKVVKFLHDHREEGCTTQALDDAAGKGYLDIVEFLHTNRSEGCTVSAMNCAAGAGHLNVVKFLHENRTEGCTEEAMDDAAGGGHLHVVRFLHEHREEGCTKRAMDDAILGGHVSVVKFLAENRVEGYHRHILNEADLTYTNEIGRVIKYLEPNRAIDRASRRKRMEENGYDK